jgi:hypothetical protein
MGEAKRKEDREYEFSLSVGQRAALWFVLNGRWRCAGCGGGSVNVSEPRTLAMFNRIFDAFHLDEMESEDTRKAALDPDAPQDVTLSAQIKSDVLRFLVGVYAAQGRICYAAQHVAVRKEFTRLVEIARDASITLVGDEEDDRDDLSDEREVCLSLAERKVIRTVYINPRKCDAPTQYANGSAGLCSLPLGGAKSLRDVLRFLRAFDRLEIDAALADAEDGTSEYVIDGAAATFLHDMIQERAGEVGPRKVNPILERLAVLKAGGGKVEPKPAEAEDAARLTPAQAAGPDGEAKAVASA